VTHRHNNTRPDIWRNALFAVFVLAGAGQATWITRTPAIRESLGFSVGDMGWVIFGLSVGSVAGLTIAGRVVAARGARLGMTLGALCIGGGLLLIASGSAASSGWLAFCGIAISGAGFGLLEVALNVEGAELERTIRKTCLPAIHAAFSLGMVGGSAVGALAAFAGVPVLIHLGTMGVLVMLGSVIAVRFIAAGTGMEEPQVHREDGSSDRRIQVWRERRTILIGLVVFGMAFAEGSGNDWIPLAMVDGHASTESGASLAFSVYAGMMTLVRAVGGRLVDKFGRIRMLRALGITAASGLLFVIFGPTPEFAVLGAGLWGAGVALGFPLGLSAAADDPRGTAARVSAVATVGYTAFLVGPPALGLLGDRAGILTALLPVIAAVAVAIFFASATRPLSWLRTDSPAVDATVPQPK
jgi:predicted MFS family arabinose efflux permease